ncbi:MAG: hypothetical protein RJA99_2955 [Pseudomonadota bacterium]
MTAPLRHFDGDEAAVVADTRRWLERAVIGLNLCPFAKAVHAKGRIRWVVTGASDRRELLDELKRELRLLAEADPEAIDTTLLVHPHALADFGDYLDFVDQAERALRKAGLEGTLQIATFHPDYAFADAPPDDPANHTNRSPHPMLHLLREASLDRAVEAFPDAADIYGRNVETLRRLGHAGWRQLFADDGA